MHNNKVSSQKAANGEIKFDFICTFGFFILPLQSLMTKQRNEQDYLKTFFL